LQTPRWREIDSNFCFLPERRRAASGHFLKDACGEAARLSVESGFGRQGIWSGLKHDVECFSEQAFSTAPGGKKRVETDGLNPGRTDGSNPSSSSGESANLRFLRRAAARRLGEN
jgi:hypothetical protein